MYFRIWRRGKGFEPTDGFTHHDRQASRCFANSDLSVSLKLTRDIWFTDGVKPHQCKKLPQMIAEPDQQIHEPVLPRERNERQGDRINRHGNY